MNKLEQLRRFLGSIRNINQGGCGIAALALYYTAQRLGINGELLCMYDNDDEMFYESNIRRINGDSDQWFAVTHVVFIVDGCVLDPRTINFSIHNYDYKHYVTPEVLECMLNADNWNRAFDRHKHLPIIEKRIGFNLKIK